MRQTVSVMVALAAIVVLSLMAPLSDAADSYDSPDGTYEYSKHGSGSDTNPYWSEILSLSCRGDVVFLQSSLEGYGVTTVTSLSGCEAGTVVVPRTVTSVADGALDDSSVERMVFLGDRPEMDIPGDVDVVVLEGTSGWDSSQETISLSEYRGDGTSFTYYILDGDAYIYGALDSRAIAVPDEDPDGHPFVGVDSEAFRDGDVTSVVLGANVASIGTRAFYGCESLETVVMGGWVRDIRDEAFRYCINLEDVDLDGVRTIGFEAFRDCRSFTSIEIPDSVAGLGGGAFYICRSATSLELGDGVDTVPERAFGYCSSLESVDMTGMKVIGESAFISCTSLRSVILDSSTMSIGDSAFSGCTYLESVELGDSLASLGGQVFSECRMLVTLTFPETLESIGERVFFHCNNLTDVYFEGDMPDILGDLLFGTTDVTVHIYDTHSGSWGAFDGYVVAERTPVSDSDEGFPVMATVVAIVLILAIATCIVFKVRR